MKKKSTTQKLKNIPISIKELEEIEDEIQELDDPMLRYIYLKKWKSIQTTEDAKQLQKEIKVLRESLDKEREKVIEIDHKKELYQNNLENLTDLKDQFLKKIEEAIENCIKIRKNVEKEIEVIETIEIVKRHQSILLDALFLIYLMKSDMNKMLKIPLTVVIVEGIYGKLQEKEVTITHYEYKYDDVEDVIEKAMDSIDHIEIEMKESLDSVQDTITDFEKDFEEYQDLKEFKDLLDMLKTVEQTLQKEFVVVQEIQDNLEESFDINEDKVLKKTKNNTNL